MDRHGTFEAYCAAKENIFKFQKGREDKPAVSIFNADDPITADWFERYNKKPGRRCLRFKAADAPQALRQVFKLPGGANLSNLAASAVVAREFGVTDDRIEELNEFKGKNVEIIILPNYSEKIKKNQIEFLNQLKGSCPNLPDGIEFQNQIRKEWER